MRNFPGVGIPVEGIYFDGVVTVGAGPIFKLAFDQTIEKAFTAHQSFGRMSSLMFSTLTGHRSGKKQGKSQ